MKPKSKPINSPLDEAIRTVYLRDNASADDILTSPRVAVEFATKVRTELCQGDDLPDEAILRRLLGLRKLGEDRGGLPRSRREYHGRRTQSLAS
jgi:hypothetical protein